jgi:putative spermidine/putrescine transport system ATP-binding protein
MAITESKKIKPIVRFEHIDKSFDGETLVIKDLNLDIAQGEFLTMLGPSGSGKTTTLMMLAGFETPTHGEIFFSGQSISNIPPHKRNIGMVFQDYSLFPHMTVKENLAFPLKVRKLTKSEIDQKVTRALEMVELKGFEGRMPAQLSGGQQQRVALARALVFEPKLVLMDEPLGALDKNLREQMQYEIKHIHDNIDVTVVYVTHDQSEAMTMSDRIAVFDDGIIRQLSTPDILYEKPENAFVAQFIGENNRLSGKVSEINGDKCVVEMDDGGFLKALKVNVNRIGERTTVSLRPERVTVNPAEGSIDNIFVGKVEELIYLGDHVRTRVNVCGNDEFIVKIPNAQGQRIVSKGQQIQLGWLSDDCRALDPLE